MITREQYDRRSQRMQAMQYDTEVDWRDLAFEADDDLGEVLTALEQANAELARIHSTRPARHVLVLNSDGWRVSHPLSCDVQTCRLVTADVVEFICAEYESAPLPLTLHHLEDGSWCDTQTIGDGAEA